VTMNCASRCGVTVWSRSTAFRSPGVVLPPARASSWRKAPVVLLCSGITALSILFPQGQAQTRPRDPFEG